MKLRDLLDTDLLNQHCRDGYIKLTNHPRLPIYILNYTPECQFGNHWDDVTEQCRGLIVDENGTVIARPFRKFFNYSTDYRPETQPQNLPTAEPEVTDKMDGSLGVFWSYGTSYGVATRGSFTSDQALWATDWLQHQEYGLAMAECFGKTLLAEIIFPENRIVVKYDFSGLVLLAEVDVATGAETCLRCVKNRYGWFAPTVEMFPFSSFEKLHDEQRDNAEGYVLTWRMAGAQPFRVKMKFQAYQRLHRLLTGLNPKALWEMMVRGDSLEEIIKDVPDEFYRWVRVWQDRLGGGYASIEKTARETFERIGGCEVDPTNREQRREFAEKAKQQFPLTPLLFALLDKNPSYGQMIWKMIKPRGDADHAFRKDVDTL